MKLRSVMQPVPVHVLARWDRHSSIYTGMKHNISWNGALNRWWRIRSPAQGCEVDQFEAQENQQEEAGGTEKAIQGDRTYLVPVPDMPDQEEGR